jgi:hypothetical protein
MKKVTGARNRCIESDHVRRKDPDIKGVETMLSY